MLLSPLVISFAVLGVAVLGLLAMHVWIVGNHQYNEISGRLDHLQRHLIGGGSQENTAPARNRPIRRTGKKAFRMAPSQGRRAA